MKGKEQQTSYGWYTNRILFFYMSVILIRLDFGHFWGVTIGTFRV